MYTIYILLILVCKLILILIDCYILQIYFQAFIFWVVDNFLKKKAFKITPQQTTSNGGGNENGMKYFTAVETVKYYERTEHADESESDVLLSLDEDGDLRYTRGVENGGLREGSGSEYQLLNAAEVT